MSKLKLGEVNDDTLQATSPPTPIYYVGMAILGAGLAMLFLVWWYQIHTGMGVAGINHPVGWGVYIANFVFWVGIAHSGTLISAILFLVRAKWRDAVSRSAEAMTIFAIMTAGLFPLIHLGRFWVFYFILPYPSQRQLWPNFVSPLVFDVLAVSTYFAVSLIFFYVGLIPDLAAARDRMEEKLGPDHWRTRMYRVTALGWSGAASQWRHYTRSYLFFAALATPLVISVHSIVSWDFAVSLLPGWHTTIFAPYFVAGAIHSGLAMVLVLLIPIRRWLNLKRLIEIRIFDKVAQTMLVTTAIMGYSYLVEPFIAWYTGDVFEQQFTLWRMFTGWIRWAYWPLLILNVLVPATFVLRRARRSLPWLLFVSACVVAGMWLERYFIVVGSTAHDFLPHNWGFYEISWVEIGITVGSAAWFLFWFFLFVKLFPSIPIADMKDQIAEEKMPEVEPCDDKASKAPTDPSAVSVLAVFSEPAPLLHGVKKACEEGFRQIETFSPVKLQEVQSLLKHPRSPVRFWTLAGALGGLVGGFSLAILAALVNELIVGGKHPVALIPYAIVGFECTILFGSIFNLIGLIIHSRLIRTTPLSGYDRRFSRDKFGVLITCHPEELDILRKLVASMDPEEIHVRR